MSFLLEFFVARLVHRICYVEILIVVLLPLIGLSSLQNELKLPSQRTCFNCWGPELIIFEVFFASRDIGISSGHSYAIFVPFVIELKKDLFISSWSKHMKLKFIQHSLKRQRFEVSIFWGGKLIPKSNFSCLVLLQSNEIHRI